LREGKKAKRIFVFLQISLILIFTVISFIFVYVLKEFLIYFNFNDKYLNEFNLLWFLFLGNVFIGGSKIPTFVIYFKNKNQFKLLFSVISALGTLSITMVFISAYGLYAPAIGFLSGHLIYLILSSTFIYFIPLDAQSN